MQSLKDKLSGQPAPTMQTGVQDDTQRTQNLLRTKLGKASTDSQTPRISNLQEQQAVSAATAGLDQMQVQGRLRAEQLQNQEDQVNTQFQEQSLDNKAKLAELDDAFTRRSEEILNELSRADKTLDSERKTAKLEQLGFMLRLQDKDYLANLEREGARARLENQINYKEQLARDIFNEDLDAFKDEIMFREFINAEQRDFDDYLNQMDINSAMKVAKSKLKNEKSKAMWSGGASMVMGALGGGGGGTAASSVGNSDDGLTEADSDF